jgi:hypothetical protein
VAELPRAKIPGVNLLERFEENIGAIAVSSIAAIIAAVTGWFLTILVSAKFITGEWSYGVPLLFGIPIGLVLGVSVFVLVFRKLR